MRSLPRLGACAMVVLPPLLSVTRPCPAHAVPLAVETTSHEIPAGGDVVVIFPSLDYIPEVPLYDADSGEELEGSVIREGFSNSDAWVVFRPDRPLIVGQHLRSDFATTERHFTVVEPRAFDVSTVKVVANHEVTSSASDSACCPVDPSAWDARAWLCTSEREHLYIPLRISLEEPAPEASQYFFHVAYAPDHHPGDSGRREFPSFSSSYYSFDKTSPSYCYTVSAESLRDGSVVEVMQACLEGYDGVALEERAVPIAEIERVLTDCPSPPEGWEERWCEVQEAHCETAPSANCAEARALCDAGPSPAVEGDDAADKVPTPAEESTPTASESCSASPARASGSAWVLSGWALALGWLARRRRTQGA